LGVKSIFLFFLSLLTYEKYFGKAIVKLFMPQYIERVLVRTEIFMSFDKMVLIFLR